MEQENKILEHFDSIFDTKTVKSVNKNNLPMLHTIFMNLQDELFDTSNDYNKYLKSSNKILNKLKDILNQEQEIMLKEYLVIRNKMLESVNEQLFMFGYLTAIQLREETIEQFKSNCKNEKIKKAIEYFRGKTLEEGDNLTMTVDFLENLEVLLNYIEVI